MVEHYKNRRGGGGIDTEAARQQGLAGIDGTPTSAMRQASRIFDKHIVDSISASNEITVKSTVVFTNGRLLRPVWVQYIHENNISATTMTTLTPFQCSQQLR